MAVGGSAEKNSMSAEVLLDTNVLVYAFDADERVKQARALELLVVLQRRGSAAVSSQVLGEFFVTATRKFPVSMDTTVAASHVQRFAEVFEVLDCGLAVTLEALRGVVRYRLAFYDAQVWASARLNHVAVVLSEDLPGAAEIEGVSFVNPFAPDFDVSTLG